MDISQAIVTVAPTLAPYITALGITATARKAIARLVMGGVDVLMGPLDDRSQKQRDDRESATIIRKAIAEVAAKTAAADPALVERALSTFASEAVRKQEAREGVAKEALKVLSDQSSQDGARDSTSAGPDVDVDEDWLNIFLGYAEKASSDRLRVHWGRVLAGEIRKPGTFSGQSMRILSEIDSETARIFEKFTVNALTNAIFREGRGFRIPEAVRCEAAGLISGSGDTINRSASVVGDKSWIFGNKFALAITPAVSWSSGIYLITPAGMEIMSIMSPPNEEEELTRLAGIIGASNPGVEIVMAKNDGNTYRGFRKL